MLGRLSAGLAHEIRNPLGSIAGSVQLLRTSRALSDDDRRLCEIIQREASRLNDLVTDMMDVSRRASPSSVIVNATRTAREVVDLASKSGRGVSDVRVVCSAADECVAVQGGRLAAASAHLESGSQRGSGVDRRAARFTSTSEYRRRNVVLAVKDDGVGIEPEAR